MLLPSAAVLCWTCEGDLCCLSSGDLEDTLVNDSINLIVFFSHYMFMQWCSLSLYKHLSLFLRRDLNMEVISVEYIFAWEVVRS